MAPIGKPGNMPKKQSKLTDRWRVTKVGRGYKVLEARRRPAPGALASKKRGRLMRKGAKGGRIRKATNKQGVADHFCRRGILMTVENGNVILGSAATPFQSVTVGHSNHGCQTTMRVISFAIVKAILKFAQVNFNNVSDEVHAIAGRTLSARFEYRRWPTDVMQNLQINWFSGTTVAQAAESLYTSLFVASTSYAIILDKCILRWGAEGGLTSVLNIGSFDLNRCKIDLYSKSSLKVQNRTISSTGNDEADDVDNAPLIGKQYDGTGNYIQVESTYLYPPQATLANVFAAGNQATDRLAEPQPLSVIKRAKKMAGVKLEPGQVKTSVLYHRQKYSLNTLIKILQRPVVDENLCSIGKFRYMVLEKQIQAVGTTDANSIQLAFESDLSIGAICTIPRVVPVTVPVTLYPL